jgi:Patatin-like phospholipase
VADQTERAAEPGERSFGQLFEFHEIFEREIEIVNARRAQQAELAVAIDVEIRRQPGEIDIGVETREIRRAVTPDAEGREQRGAFELEIEAAADVAERPVLRPPESANVVGLALSGGGIRSAAFCLGVLQALDRTKVLDSVDYMSTVSGGGYIGCSLTAGLESTGQFPFTSGLKEDEPPALQQIRNYSNYLFPNGVRDLLANGLIYARGLVVNAVLLAPFLFVASVLTLLYYAGRDSQRKLAELIFAIINPFGLRHFYVTIDLALLLVLVLLLWGIARSMAGQNDEPEIPGQWSLRVVLLLIVLFVALFCDAQPFVLDAMLHRGTNNFAVVAIGWIKTIAAILAPVSAAMGYLADKLGEYVKNAMQSPKWSALISAVALKAAIFVAGLVLPVVLWLLYLEVTYWGICINEPAYACLPAASLASASYKLFGHHGYAATLLYFVVAILLIPISLISRPNANSLHPLYRDRLRKAFLFVPEAHFRANDQDLPPFDTPLSQISSLNGPYHLVNAALNVEDSKTANRRGRNADFFIFSPLFVGSKSTDYVMTGDVEKVAIGFDFATAMAVSGAAVSSNMGAQNIKPLTATLALLNIRLGYWLRNPRRLADAPPPTLQERGRVSEFRRKNNLAANYYFLAEIFGLLSENLKSIYLTDGGHIENLGIDELLRRRCRVIIAVDAEADPQMAFGCFNMLERYALIDLGIRIDLPWEQIAIESLATGQAIDKAGDVSAEPTAGAAGDKTTAASGKKAADASGDEAGAVPKHHGPHCAVGEISYPGGRKGILVYIKASLTGDENDYIFDYKKRYSAFPHETTLDQWFTEEQFEAYRALGFHAAFNLFDRSDKFAHLDPNQNPDVRPQIELLDRLFPRVESAAPPVARPKFADWLPKAKARGQGRRGSPESEVAPG